MRAATTLLAGPVHFVLARLHRARIRHVAIQWKMHYTPDDRFQLGQRIVDKLPVPGAADVHVRDVIYASEGEAYRYFFTVEYTTGVLRRKVDHRRVCTLIELKDHHDDGLAFPLKWASQG